MDRNELKGKQTPGEWHVTDDRHGTWVWQSDSENCIAGAYSDVRETDANAMLIAEAGTVSNRTGMWPLDMVERIKELESALKIVQSAAKLEAAKPGPTFCEELRDALNMVDHVLSKRP